MKKEKRKGEPNKTYLVHLTILLLVMGIISGVWFVFDWFQPLRKPNILAELIPDEQMEEVYRSEGYPEIESITAHLQENLEIGVSVKSEVIDFMEQYAPTKYTPSSYKFDDCVTEDLTNNSLYCNVLIHRNFRNQVDTYYAMFFEFDTALASINGIAYERRFKSYAINPFLGLATIVFLLAALVVVWRLRDHRKALRQTIPPDVSSTINQI